MAAGEARQLHRKTGKAVMIVGVDGRPRWNEIWRGLSYLLKGPAGVPVISLMNCGGHRPYIAGKTPQRWTWKPYVPKRTEIIFTPEELEFAEPYRGMVMLEPNVKATGHDNKAWLAVRWIQLAHDIVARGIKVVQCVPPGHNHLELKVARTPETPTFRHAAAVLSVARAFVGTEGGLHHAAAAVGTPAVILWSEFISPEITGYERQTNIRHAGNPCGSRIPCAGCKASMNAITVSEVVQALEKIL